MIGFPRGFEYLHKQPAEGLIYTMLLTVRMYRLPSPYEQGSGLIHGNRANGAGTADDTYFARECARITGHRLKI